MSLLLELYLLVSCLFADGLIAASAPSSIATTASVAPQVGAPVRAIVVGVSTYGPRQQDGTYRWAQPQFRNSAEEFAGYLKELFGEKAVTLILDNEATINRLKQELNGMLNLDAGTLVIFYFAGHGLPDPPVEPAVPRGLWPNTTLLALHEADPLDKKGTNYGNVISTEELATSFAHASQCNYMIFLDCCHASTASVVAQAPAQYVNDLQYRGFALVSSQMNEYSTRCRFTTALLDVWKSWKKTSNEFDLERTADELRKDVNAKISQMKDHPTSEAPSIPFGDKSAKMGQLSRGNCLVSFSFHPPVRNSFNISMDGHPPVGFDGLHPYCYLTLPRDNVSVTINFVGVKPVTIPLDLRSVPYFVDTLPSPEQLTGAGPPPASTSQQQQQALQEYTRFVACAVQHKVPLDKVALAPLGDLRREAQYLDLKPFIQVYVAAAPQEDVNTKAVRHVLDSRPIPLNNEGQAIADALRSSGLGGYDLLTQFNIGRAQLAIANPEQAATAFTKTGRDPETQLTFFFERAVKDAALSQYPVNYKTELDQLYERLTENKDAVLGKSDRQVVQKIYGKARTGLQREAWDFTNSDGSVNSDIIMTYGHRETETKLRNMEALRNEIQ